MVVLLHALATTGLLTWYPSIATLTERYRVVTLDQRCHGRGIRDQGFRIPDCADDVAALLDALSIDRAVVAGYSMGGIVAQRVWRQHPGRVRGLVLAATTDHFMTTVRERVFHHATGLTMRGLRVRAGAPVAAASDPVTEPVAEPLDLHDWALAQMRSTSPVAVAQAVAILGRHHSRPWLGRIDVPTAVLVTLEDRVFPAERQIAMARRIPGATTHEIRAGHACVVRQADRFVPAFAQALHTVHARAEQAESASMRR
ncbi:alpha/beta fold hydrolase [Nocardioides alcanivorans]|uniref:alpha/beta fold hydrolase n=1 Tax=Nocardioides alcanivorans TaxID=2897352 RepID=UPI001F3BFFE4|nr:alpha/beta fold hydrolase [Nocardioides alcanivorans]